MFRWYREADVCYAYLSDVPSGGDSENLQQPNSAFRCSQWFTRGWTLQELLAPETVVFFNADWEDIGTKYSMEDLLSSITGISLFEDFDSACVAQKFSWGSKRQTTREEDGAYCLMGLFGVHMLPLYGEGRMLSTGYNWRSCTPPRTRLFLHGQSPQFQRAKKLVSLQNRLLLSSILNSLKDEPRLTSLGQRWP